MLEAGPPVIPVSSVEAFRRLEDWEQTQFLCALQIV